MTASPLSTASPARSPMSTSTSATRRASGEVSILRLPERAARRRHATLTAEQLAAITAVEVPLDVVQDPNGKNIGTATWTYSVADGAFDFLAAGETLTLTYIARVDNNFAPNNETTFVPFTITITGTNDKPTIAATGGDDHRADRHRQCDDRHRHRHGHLHRSRSDRPPGRQRGISPPIRSAIYDAEGNDVTATLTAAATGGDPAVQVPLTVVQAAGNSHNGSATWTYSIADNAFDFLANGETLILNYVATGRRRPRRRHLDADHRVDPWCRRRGRRHQRRADYRRRRARRSRNCRTPTSRTRLARPPPIRCPAPSASPMST